jgi:transposase
VAICITTGVERNLPKSVDELSDDPKVLKDVLRDTLRALQEQNCYIEALTHRLDRLLRKVFGHQAERVNVAQLQLALAEVVREAEPEPVEVPARKAVEEAFLGPAPNPAGLQRRRKGHGRSRLPAELKRERIEYGLTEAERACPDCGRQRAKIGETVSEQLDYVPASVIVRQHIRFKYACPHCQEHVAIASAPPQPIEKGLPGPGLLAQVLVSKFADHLPLHRQSVIFGRHGIRLSPSTLGGWVEQGAFLLEPLVLEEKRRILGSHVIGSDDTPVPVLDRGRDHTRLGRLWVYVGDDEHPYTVYEYTPNRGGEWPRKFLEGFRGYLQADAYPALDALYKPDPLTGEAAIVEVACWAHSRRKFHEAQKSDFSRSLISMAFIRMLYKIEEEARGLDPPSRQALRQEKARPWLDHFKLWLQAQKALVLPKSPIGEAIHYAVEQWTALCRYLEDGRLEIDNNRTERALRGVAVGRRNWSFAGSDEGGKRAAIIYSVIESARRHGLDPFAYLRDILARVATHPQQRIGELLPDQWKAGTAK